MSYKNNLLKFLAEKKEAKIQYKTKHILEKKFSLNEKFLKYKQDKISEIESSYRSAAQDDCGGSIRRYYFNTIDLSKSDDYIKYSIELRDVDFDQDKTIISMGKEFKELSKKEDSIRYQINKDYDLLVTKIMLAHNIDECIMKDIKEFISFGWACR